MSLKYLPLADAAAQSGLTLAFLHMLAGEELIALKHTLDGVEVIAQDELKRAQLVALLTQELEVNLAGAEVILRMRDEMIAMRLQFDEILADLVDELKRGLAPESRHE